MDRASASTHLPVTVVHQSQQQVGSVSTSRQTVQIKGIMYASQKAAGIERAQCSHVAHSLGSLGQSGFRPSSQQSCGLREDASSSQPARARSINNSNRSIIGRRIHARAPLGVICQASSDKLTIAITGATGLVGSRLTSKLAAQGYKVRVLTRDASAARSKLPYPGVTVFPKAQWAEAIQGADAVVNLAGEPIATRWTPELKASIKSSRVATTKAVVDAILAAPEDKRPKVLVSGSAVGYYGNSQSASYVEDSPAGGDYLAEICKDWEAAAMVAQDKGGVRTVIVRIGIVLAPEGGALGKMLPMFQIFAGGPLGSGRQWMSWIHRDDLVSLIQEAIRNPSYSGVYNATAPKPVRMGELCSELGKMMGRPSWLPVPDFALNAVLGEGASVVLEGQCVLPARTQAQGFQFKYQDVNSALKNILRR